MHAVDRELAMVEDLELEVLLHELVRADSSAQARSPHFQRRLILACFRLR